MKTMENVEKWENLGNEKLQGVNARKEIGNNIEKTEMIRKEKEGGCE